MKKLFRHIPVRGLITLIVLISVSVGPTCLMPEIYAKTAKKTASTKKSSSNKTPVRAAGDVRKEKQRTEKEIAETKKKLSETQKKITNQLNNLSHIDSQIERQESTIGELTSTIEQLEEKTQVLNDSISRLMYTDSLLCRQVAENLRQRHVQKKRITPLGFVAGAGSVTEAMQRISFLTAVGRAESRQVNRLRRQRQQIEATRATLDSVRTGHEAAVKQLATAKSILDARRQESQKVVNNLRTQTQTLNSVLKEKQKRITQLNNELSRIIAEEQRKAKEEEQRKQKQASTGSKSPTTTTAPTGTSQGVAEATRTLTGSFAANKGKLLFPVAGKYTITGTFGRSRHEQLSHVEVDNSGIDITVPSGTKARSSFEGTVSSIFFMDGYENIIIVRHGEYLTVYAGLSSLNVKKGEKVKSGQQLGTIATIDGNTTLHFEVRKERSKLNPLQWVK